MTHTVIVQRTHTSPDGKRTFGEVRTDADAKVLCYTLEDMVREVPGKPVESWKRKGETAIPVGIYALSLVNSPKFGPDTLSIANVKGFEYIRMHAGNTELDTEGCLLLGMKIGVSGIIGGTSRPAVALLKTIVKQWITQGHAVFIDVRQLPGR